MTQRKRESDPERFSSRTQTVQRIRDILVRIRVLGSVLTDLDADSGGPETNGSGFGTLIRLHHSLKIKSLRSHKK
jgi:hypothetical protein